jgi:hypothetical protein
MSKQAAGPVISAAGQEGREVEIDGEGCRAPRFEG